MSNYIVYLRIPVVYNVVICGIFLWIFISCVSFCIFLCCTYIYYECIHATNIIFKRDSVNDFRQNSSNLI